MPYGHICSFRLPPEVTRFMIAEQCDSLCSFLLFRSLVIQQSILGSLSAALCSLQMLPGRREKSRQRC